LAARLAALAQSGLPLEGGLYALADEIAQPRLARVLFNLATRLERGEKLETAIAAEGSRLPAHLRGLIVAGIRSGRLPIVLDQFAALARRQQDLRRRVLLALAYPAVLLGIMAALMVFCHVVLTGQYARVFKDFGTRLPAITDLYFRFSGVVAWTTLVLTIAAAVFPLAALFLPLGAWLGRATMLIPVLGRIVRDDRHAQFSNLMAILLEEDVPLPEALNLTSIAMQGTVLERQCRAAAAAVEGGMPLDQALVNARFPDSLTALVAWGQKKSCLAESFRAAGEAFEARTNSQSALLNMLAPPLIYMTIVTWVGLTILAFMMPLISLISNLSGAGGGSSSGGPRPNADDWLAFAMLASVLVFLLGVVVLMRFRWFTGPAPGDRKSDYVVAIRAFAWGLTIVGFVASVVMVLPGLVNLWFAALAVIISMAYGRHVATQQYSMLALVSAAAKRSMPLETAFAALGHERGGWMRRRAAEVVHMLSHGASLPDAVRAVPGVLPSEAVPLICVGYENGSLGAAVAQAISSRNLFEPLWQSIIPKIGYICLLPPLAVGIITFIALKIVPQYQKIFRDFGTRLPEVTLDVIYACQWCTQLWPLWGAAWLFLALLFVYAVLRYTGSIRWDLPGMSRLLRRRHTATVLDAIALGSERQRPLGETLSNLALSYPQRPIEDLLRAVCDDLQAGGDDFQCLHAHGLLSRTDLALLQAARRNGNLAWAAREMADSNRRRFIYRVDAVLRVIFPLVIVGYGLIVAAVSAAMFYPLAVIIQSQVRNLP